MRSNLLSICAWRRATAVIGSGNIGFSWAPATFSSRLAPSGDLAAVGLLDVYRKTHPKAKRESSV
jgi:hypothetical protein